MSEEEKQGAIVITGTAGSLGKAVARRFCKEAATQDLTVIGLDG